MKRRGYEVNGGRKTSRKGRKDEEEKRGQKILNEALVAQTSANRDNFARFIFGNAREAHKVAIDEERDEDEESGRREGHLRRGAVPEELDKDMEHLKTINLKY